MGPKFGAQKGNKLGSQLGPMSITKLSPNWACQMGPIHLINFLLSGVSTGVDLSKILGGQTNISGGRKVLKCDKCMGVNYFSIIGRYVPGLPQFYSYAIGPTFPPIFRELLLGL